MNNYNYNDSENLIPEQEETAEEVDSFFWPKIAFGALMLAIALALIFG